MPAEAPEDLPTPLSIVGKLNNGVIDSNQNDQSNYFYYFAYGSNLWSRRIHLSNPSAEYLGVGFLPNFSLGFAGPVTQGWGGCSATIWPLEDSAIDGLRAATPSVSHLLKKYKENGVYGVIWRLKMENSATLDAQEYGYLKIHVDATLMGENTRKLINCRTYVMSTSTIAKGQTMEVVMHGKPSPIYQKVIISGALEHTLPIDYVEFLKSFKNNNYDGPIKVAIDEKSFLVGNDQDSIPA